MQMIDIPFPAKVIIKGFYTIGLTLEFPYNRSLYPIEIKICSLLIYPNNVWMPRGHWRNVKVIEEIS